MLKKILLVSAVLASTTTIAMASGLAPYVGASTGVNVMSADKVGVTAYRGVPLNVFAGYGGTINENFYLAGEVTGTLATGQITNNNQLKTTYGYGASVLPGVMLSDHTLAFARAGLLKSRFSKVNSTKSGAELGVGMQTSLTQNVDLRGEYDFVAYNHLNYNGDTISPRADQFNVGVVYKFD